MAGGAEGAVLDTTALLHWPLERLAGGVCAPSQLDELERLSPARRMLIEAAQLEWMNPTPAQLEHAQSAAAATGDLPRLSTVDVDVLALALGLERVLVTDDYRLQNVAMQAGLEARPLATRGAKQPWSWIWRCTGCRREHAVQSDAARKRDGPGPDCDVCGSPTVMKRARR
ncbi:MAG TPA: nucleotide-binding protein [Candidatus Poseidoniaceae archaeon]|nr:nucleotide-binding protein [Candidatus Poseidoniaceae archaeon]